MIVCSFNIVLHLVVFHMFMRSTKHLDGNLQHESPKGRVGTSVSVSSMCLFKTAGDWPLLCLLSAGNDVKDVFASARSGDQYRVLKIVIEDGERCLFKLPAHTLAKADIRMSTWLTNPSTADSFVARICFSRAADSGHHQEGIEEVGPGVWLLSAAPHRGWCALLHSVQAGFH